jgi:stringent starvation protein B
MEGKMEAMDICDCTMGNIPYCSTDYKPYLMDGMIVWIHDNYFNQTKVIQCPFQKIVRVGEGYVWIELV